MKDSIDFMIEKQYSSIQNYDIKVRFSNLINLEELNNIKNINHVKDVEPVLETGVEISNGWKTKQFGFTALVKDPQMYRVEDKDGNIISLPQNGLIVSEKLADILGIKLNDSVNVKFYFPGKEKKDMVVKGIVVQYLGLSTYTSMDSLKSLLGEGMIANSAVLKLDDIKFENDIKDKLRDIPSVASLESKTDSLNALLQAMGAMGASIGVYIILAGILLIAVLYNIATINIFERQRELATLKVLGFNNNEVKKLIFTENYIITIFGMIIGLPVGKWLGASLMKTSSTDAYTIPYVIEFKTYIIAIILTLLFTVITNLTLIKKIKALDMIEVLKNKE